MKILVPVKNLFFWVEVIKNWADEIYFWFTSDDWLKKYKYTNPLNARSMFHSIHSNENAKKLIDFANSKNVHTYITLNRVPPFVDEELLEKEIKNILSLKPSWIIFKDLYIAEIIRKYDKDIVLHCSSLNQVINKNAISFWVDNYNVKRIILPRNIAVNEIVDLCNNFPDLEFEIFVKNSWCYNSDWICSSLHEEWVKKWLKYVCFREENYESEDENFNKKFHDFNNKLVCKMCIIWKLKQLKNLVSIKIVWRDKTLPRILNDLEFVKKSRDFLFKADNYDEFVEETMNIHKKVAWKSCWFNTCEFYNYYYKK